MYPAAFCLTQGTSKSAPMFDKTRMCKSSCQGLNHKLVLEPSISSSGVFVIESLFLFHGRVIDLLVIF